MAQTFRDRWEDWRPTKTQAAWFGVGCIAATLIAGFGFGGWVTGGTAEQRISEAASNARYELAAAVCVEEFMRADNAGQRLAKLHDLGWWERSELVAKGGWATMPDRQEPNSTVASMCAATLSEKKI
ncbi:MAG TPA: hypothetical protein VM489_05720 [Burkholderiales bacterium]|nr:hypothetical protein [Burkholderiales bacterium]